MGKRIKGLQARKKWLLDAAIFLSGLVAALSGIYFLFIPSGGYQGGRNPMYGVTILFSRHTWEDLHTWSGLLMIAIAVLHFAIHWRWVTVMSKRTVKALLSEETKLSKGSRLNVTINVLVAVSFLLTAVSGVCFLFAPSGGFQGGRNAGWDPVFLLAVDQEHDQTVLPPLCGTGCHCFRSLIWASHRQGLEFNCAASASFFTNSTAFLHHFSMIVCYTEGRTSRNSAMMRTSATTVRKETIHV